MGPDGLHRPSQLCQHGQLTQREAVVHHQSQASRHLIFTYDGCLHLSPVVHLHIEGVEVVAAPVLVGKEGLAGILRRHKPGLHVVVIAELIAQPVFVAIAGVGTLVALSLVSGNTGVGHQFVTTVLGNILQRGEALWLLLSDVEKALQ